MDPTNIPDSDENKINESQSDDINDGLNVEDPKNYCADQPLSEKNIKKFVDNCEKSPNEQQCLQEEHEQLAIPTDQRLSSDHDFTAGYETLLGITNHVERLINEIQEQTMKNKHLNDLQRKYEDLFKQKISVIVEKDIKCNERENFKTNTLLNTAYDEVGKFKANLEKNDEELDGDDDKCLQSEKNGFEEQHDQNLYSQTSELKPQLNEERNQEFEEINLFQVLWLMAQERDELKDQLSDLSEESDLKEHDLKAKLGETAEELRLVGQEREELKQKLSDLSEESDLKEHDLKAKLGETAEELRLVGQEREELKQKLSDLSEESDLKTHGLEAKLSETTEELHLSLLENVKELGQYRNLKESEVKSLKQNIANLSANMITLGAEKGSLQSQKSELKDQLRDIIVKFNFMSEECQKLEDYKCKQEKEEDVLKQQIQTLREEKEKLREYPQQFENLNHQHSTLKRKLKELEEKSVEETSMLKERFKSLQQEKYAIEKKFFKRLQNEQDRHRKQLKVYNQKFCYQMMKAERSIAAAMQFIKMHSNSAEWSAPVTEIIKFLEAKAMQIVKPDDLINMQTDRDFDAHLQRLEKKCNELKTTCRLHYKEREEKERKRDFIKIENSDYDSEDQNLSKADQIRSLKEQCKALNKELKFVKTKYQITRIAMKNAP
uniref:Uncharacterized protein n=1 Tax=Glossina austeni TaxID=7395 RepID=A0A1A9UXC6_GLOAU